MESHSYATTSSSSSSSSSYYPEGKGKGGTKPQPSSYESSRSIHGRVPKHMTNKLPIAPFPRTPPKIYKVEAEKFKETVQMLTTAPGFQSNNPARRLQEVAPPPLNLKPRKCSHNNNALSEHQIIRSETTLHEGARDIPPILSPGFSGDGFSQLWAFSPIGFGPLSPSSLAHWASILPSPGTLSSL
ncbi:PREDICTED: uncharacterized protein LOC109188837 [Ipomoea nil]|uniref:uncharacterized protein LOC109188837 n=1 Tax=Ipomoea nil TaxID=35883 RepID=UPI000900A013|nr:PREDICTED: uncharacterized protein LOC109188837 [Ipomoea nil]